MEALNSYDKQERGDRIPLTNVSKNGKPSGRGTISKDRGVALKVSKILHDPTRPKTHSNHNPLKIQPIDLVKGFLEIELDQRRTPLLTTNII